VLEIPAGMRDVPGEPTEVTAERELVEEIGMKVGRLELLTEMFPASGMTDSVLSIFLATELTHVGREVHGPEETHMEVLDLSLAEAVAMVLRGEIRDSKTIIGLLMVERRLGLARS
jgi:8-oxo-dGTP pyrophosphatase MutT (NUDIX family)